MPAIHRVIMTLTSNPVYTGFWNYTASVWAEKFHLKPTLIFYGSGTELCTFAQQNRPDYEVFHVERVPEATLNLNLEWGCTWSLFYGAAQFPNDTCLLVGIDQIPLNRQVLNKIEAAPDANFIVGLSDAYQPDPTHPQATFPSTHLVATGQKFKTVFGIDDDWRSELLKVFGCRGHYPLPADAWGLDEAYASELLRARIRSHGDVTLLQGFHQEFQATRLWRGKDNLATMDINGIRAGRYSEWHATRPFETNDPALLQQLKDAIPEYA